MHLSRTLDAPLLKIIPPLAALLIRTLMRSCRVVEVEGERGYREALSRSGGAAVYTTWHQRMPYFFYYFRSRKITILISGSRDGEYAARMAAQFGFRNVRGSSTRGGTRAMRELIRMIRSGERGGLLADGPQGPARIAKLGVVLAARDAQVPIIPVTWGADQAWIFSSWDRFLVPKPASRIAIFFAEPIWIPREARIRDLETYRQLVENRLNDGARWCDTRFGAERPWRKPAEKDVPVVGPL